MDAHLAVCEKLSAMPTPTFGDVPGSPPGSAYQDRAALYAAGVHRHLQAGILGRGAEGAESIVLNEGYEDDEDRGDEIIYTGEGGRDPSRGVQIADQQLTRGNLALAKSAAEGLPVRVIRGPKLKSPYAPAGGYRYDGQYAVEDYWQDRGKSGFLIWRYKLRRNDSQPALGVPPAVPAPAGSSQPTRKASTVQRIVRNTDITQWVKNHHDHQCQICGLRLEIRIGGYAEGAHIRPLGRPHNGPDEVENVLCLCPNCHVLFDAGMITVEDNLMLTGAPGRLRTSANHAISVAHLRYHREHYRAS